jgi:hypothetical protein
MREHALPQDVTGYKFHIIGNMTLKQFAEVASGCVAGFFVYQTNLPIFIKWPTILLLAGAGAFAAFVPFEERPFDHWIVAFFKALYRPTQFYWTRSSKIPDAFLYKNNSNLILTTAPVDLTPARRQRVTEFLHTVSSNTTEQDPLDERANQHIDSVMSFFSQNPADQFVTAAPVSTTVSDEQIEDVMDASAPEVDASEVVEAIMDKAALQMPAEPNKVVGLVLDANNTPLTNVIVEVLTQDGLSARAVKTNNQGQFFITTPLNEGTYIIQAEKEGLQFSPQQLIVDGNLIAPIELHSFS